MIHFGQIKFGSNRFRNKFFLFLLIIVLIIAAFNFFQTWRKNHEINNEINELHNQISNLEKNNLELNELISYFNSNAYIEEKARVDLGLKKEGEKVVMVANLLNDANAGKTADGQKNNQTEAQFSNFKKWLNYFLK